VKRIQGKDIEKKESVKNLCIQENLEDEERKKSINFTFRHSGKEKRKIREKRVI